MMEPRQEARKPGQCRIQAKQNIKTYDLSKNNNYDHTSYNKRI